VLHRGATADDLGDPEAASFLEDSDDRSYEIAEDAFQEIEARLHACGDAWMADPRAYPFRVEESYLELTSHSLGSPYLFMLLLTYCAADMGPPGLRGDRLFEDLAAVAAQSFFGGEEGLAEAVRFGFPRHSDDLPGGCFEALERLCEKLGEGGRAVRGPNVDDQKDLGLDVVVWKNFPDGRPGKLVGFAQCASGASRWEDKLTQLQVENIVRFYLQGTPFVTPVKMLLVPFRITPKGRANQFWELVAARAGIVFDRCRIAHHTRRLGGELRDKLEVWNRYVLDKWVSL
jgi:hypothetical protein